MHPDGLYMFLSSRTGETYKRDSVVNYHKRILKKANLPHICLRDLLHTFATLALSNGIDVKPLSAMLVHVPAATTMDIYTHITDDMQRMAANIDCGIGKAAPQEDDSGTGLKTAASQDESRKSKRGGKGRNMEGEKRK